jgi:glycosyltransferase involved in cell wall biosynthesis
LHFHEKRLVKYLQSKNIQVILAEFGVTGAAMVKISKATGIPLVVFFHGYDAYHREVLAINKQGYDRLFQQASVVFVVSNHMFAQLRKLGCPAEKMVLNTYGPADFYFKNNPDFTSRNFLAIGRFVDKKAPHLTIRAFAQVAAKYPDAKLRMIGAGPLLPACEALVKELQLEKQVEFLGVRKPEEILQFFQSSICFVQHSVTAESGDTEGTPVAVLEAGAAGMPIVASIHAGIPDVVVNGETGFLFEEKDVATMAAGMLKIADDLSLAKKMGEVGRKRILENYTLERHISVINNSINQLTKYNVEGESD